MSAILMAWAKRSKVYHLAAGRGTQTACGAEVWTHRGWGVGANPPDGRTLCSRCVNMQRDVAKG